MARSLRRALNGIYIDPVEVVKIMKVTWQLIFLNRYMGGVQIDMASLQEVDYLNRGGPTTTNPSYLTHK